MNGLSDQGAPLVRLLYTSLSALDASAADHARIVAALVDAAATANKRRKITGAIMLVRGTFIQVLEGELEAVETVFEAICRDRRHTHVRLVELSPCDLRMFWDWSMALVGAQTDEIDFAAHHALDDIYQSLIVSPSFALKKMRAYLNESVGNAA